MIRAFRNLLPVLALAAAVPASAQTPQFGRDMSVLRDPRSPGELRQLFLPPRIVSGVSGPHRTKLAPGALLFAERAELGTQQSVNETPIALPDGRTIPAGAIFLSRVTGGVRYACLARANREALREGGVLCLADEDGDGLHDRAVSPGKRNPISPVRLRPLPVGDPKRLEAMRIEYEVRVTALDGDRAEIGWNNSLREGYTEEMWHFGGVKGRAEEPATVSLKLVPGEHASAGGLDLTVERGPGGALWLRVEGDPGWLGLGGEGSVILLRGLTAIAMGPVL